MGGLTTAETIAVWQVAATAGIGLLQCALIWVGLGQMRIASAARDRQLDNQEVAAAARHTENMRALSAGMHVIIERTGGRGDDMSQRAALGTADRLTLVRTRTA